MAKKIQKGERYKYLTFSFLKPTSRTIAPSAAGVSSLCLRGQRRRSFVCR
ncbi:hypothetical protein COLO4_07964 [Corchorus olitorius]|uniref:Uncharacterized protein n=1 Tax=Corchorus olitorius TaxID=93759 RepID=A0A1R3KHY9_9ROSI|nr:hypothetical protein COLO4_07964 [Corchorus olitorius]